jgi:hypothetical protein
MIFEPSTADTSAETLPANDRFWHITSFRQAPKFGRYWSNSRQTATGKLNKYEAIKPMSDIASVV